MEAKNALVEDIKELKLSESTITHLQKKYLPDSANQSADLLLDVEKDVKSIFRTFEGIKLPN
jgi:hypothetical protein